MQKNETTDVVLGSDPMTMFATPMIECILEHCSEYIKYSLGTVQVMLGVTPTIDALLGASTEEVCILALIAEGGSLVIYSPQRHHQSTRTEYLNIAMPARFCGIDLTGNMSVPVYSRIGD